MERFTFSVLVIFIGVGFLLTLSSFALIGIEYDEAWILASHISAFRAQAFAEVPHVVTTGGLHFFIIGAFGEAGEQVVVLARLISIASFFGSILLIERFIRNWVPDFPARMIIVLCLLATPGSLFLGAMGYAVTLASFLLIAGFVTWFSIKRMNFFGMLFAGLFFGLAFATRSTLLPVAPLLLILGITLPKEIRVRWIYGFVVSMVALIVFTALLMVQVNMGVSDSPDSRQSIFSSNIAAAGITGSLFPSPARITGFASRYFTLLSLPMTLVSLVSIVYLRPFLPRSLKLFLVALFGSAVLIAGAWVMKSPFLHTRYVWPSVLFVHIVCGICLASLYSRSRISNWETAKFIRLICLALPIGLAIETYSNGVRLIAAGSGYETNNAGYSVQENHFDAFQLVREQKAIVEFVTNNLEAEETIAGYGLPPEWSLMQLGLLAQRNIVDFATSTEFSEPPSIIISHKFSQLSDSGLFWLNSISLENASIYGYRIYWVDKAKFELPSDDYLIDQSKYRFDLRRSQSLSG